MSLFHENQRAFLHEMLERTREGQAGAGIRAGSFALPKSVFSTFHQNLVSLFVPCAMEFLESFVPNHRFATLEEITMKSTRLTLEELESRLTPSGNLHIVDAYLIGVDGTPVSDPTVGTLVRGRVDFSTTGLPDGTPFTVKFTLDNTSYTKSLVTGPLSFLATSQENWLLKPGPHTFKVELDANHQIAES